ncbi:NAD(P)-binding protein [Actinosynnema pretiosum subsp. pretiosum]|uniref:NAD(P)-binding protein n=1 Tax=Actinosynnema pretiosum subsp. pretiosum TaxID=103721 RepID=A0AA45R5K1_9PSEU|nr:hypothetical protein APASM_2696 [Actinosynnema pretiosum subsp. pretiosum]QUF05763.1 NAD(P)-binding protein [Actinosynnema pretiosum subsp. pretiosum]
MVTGSGMGGLAAARALAEFGDRRVLVLERHHVLGGMTHDYDVLHFPDPISPRTRSASPRSSALSTSTSRPASETPACARSSPPAPTSTAPPRTAPLQAEGGRSCLVLFLGFDRSPAEFGLRGENHSFVDPPTADRWRDGKDAACGQFKRDTTRRVLDRMDARWPGFSDAVAFAELATPLTFETYQNSHRGVFYGLPATPDRLREPLAGPRTPFDGLLITGQDATDGDTGGAFSAAEVDAGWRPACQTLPTGDLVVTR